MTKLTSNLLNFKSSSFSFIQGFLSYDDWPDIVKNKKKLFVLMLQGDAKMSAASRSRVRENFYVVHRDTIKQYKIKTGIVSCRAGCIVALLDGGVCLPCWNMRIFMTKTSILPSSTTTVARNMQKASNPFYLRPIAE